jgi:dihydroneopterin aldolase
LPGIVRQVLAQRTQHAALLVVGGGAAVNIVREWDRQHSLSEEISHELALAAMDLTASLVSRLIPGLREVRSIHQVRAAADDHVVGLLCADCFIKSAQAQSRRAVTPLEHSWRITSDSIAAWTAGALAAAELVLLKSVPLPRGISLHDAARDGLVDEAFPEIAATLPAIGWVNARGAQSMIEKWR